MKVYGCSMQKNMNTAKVTKVYAPGKSFELKIQIIITRSEESFSQPSLFVK
jgi:hypothetical protein